MLLVLDDVLFVYCSTSNSALFTKPIRGTASVKCADALCISATDYKWMSPSAERCELLASTVPRTYKEGLILESLIDKKIPHHLELG